VERPELLPQVKVFVLGPPRDEALIKDETGTIGVDTYELAGPGRSFFAGCGPPQAARTSIPASAARLITCRSRSSCSGTRRSSPKSSRGREALRHAPQ